MKRFFIYATAFSILFSCTKKIEEVNTPPLKIDKVNLLVNNDIAHVDSFAVQYSQAWSLTITPLSSTWLKTNITSNTGNTKVYVIVQESNTSGSIREAIINVFPSGKPDQAVSIQVKQSVKQWQQIAAFPGVGRKMASSFVIEDKFYVGLGRGVKDSKEQTLSDFYVFNATSNTWKQLSNFPGGAREFALGFSSMAKGILQQVEK